MKTSFNKVGSTETIIQPRPLAVTADGITKLGPGTIGSGSGDISSGPGA